jgi:hypothetical protein
LNYFKIINITGFLILIMVAPMSAADGSQAPQFAWWQIAGGILAIPTAIVGLIYTIHLAKKTQLESRKIQLEILEKEGKLLPGSGELPSFRELADFPKVITSRVQDFVLRFIILFLVLTGWEGIATLGSPLLAGLVFWIVNKFNSDTKLWYNILWISFMAQALSILKLIILYFLGLPLFKDILNFMGLKPSEILKRN